MNLRAEAFLLIAKGFQLLAEEAGAEVAVTPKVTTPTKEAVKPKEVVKEPMPEGKIEITEKVETEKEVAADSSNEDVAERVHALVEGKNYNDLRNMCKELGLPSKGTITVLKDRVAEHLIANSEVLVELYENEGVEAETPAKKEVVEEQEEEVEVDKVPEAPADNIAEQVFEALEGYSLEEIADILADNDVEATGTREELINKVVDLVKDGVLSFDDEDEEEDQEVLTGEAAKENPYLDLDYPEARDSVIVDIVNKTEKAVTSGKLTRTKMIKEIGDFYVPEGLDVNTLEDKDLIFKYNERLIRLVDDEGESQEFETPYELGGNPTCCGHFLKLVEGDYVCELCGTTYEAE